MDPQNPHILTRQDIRAAAGQLIIAGFDGTTLSAELRELLRETTPLGLILFSRNIENPEQVCEFGRELKDLRKDEPLLLAIDQEGGRVQRVRAPATVWPPMRELGRLRDENLIEQVGAALAQEVRAMNFDVNFAPVLDVDTNPKNPVIGDRSFASDAKTVGILGAALVRGLQKAGVAACGKHFPGHGDTDKDSHLDLPFVDHELPRLRELEWPPFKAAIAAGVASIMTAHVVVRDIDEQLPATLSKKVLSYLRDELRFPGAIVSDDIEMKAVFDRFSVSEMAHMGLQAGVDIFLACHKPEVVLELYRAIVTAVESGKVSHLQLQVAQKRARALRQTYYQPATAWQKSKHRLGPAAHGPLLENIDRRLQAGA